MHKITQQEIENQRTKASKIYGESGMSKEYNKAFDELADMNRLHMAQAYRAARGAGPDFKTPYCR